MIKFRCPHCNQKLGVPDEYASRRVKCSQCSMSLAVPDQQAAQSEPVPQPVVPEVLTTQEDFASNMPDELQLQKPDPDPIPANSNLGPGSGQSQLEDEDDFVRTNLAGIPVRKQAATETPKKKTLKAVLSTVIICAIGIAWLWFMYNSGNQRGPKQTESFAEDFITILTGNNIEAAKELFSPQKTISDAEINELLQRMANIEILDINSECLYAVGNEEIHGYLYSCEVETDRGNRTFILLILNPPQTIALANVVEINGTSGNAPRFNHDLPALTDELNKIVRGVTDMRTYQWRNTYRGMLLYWAVILVTFFSIWRLVGGEGEFNMWVFIGPPYALYLLAREGNRPGWLGMVAGFAALSVLRVGSVGALIFIPLFMIISIGVAQRYGKNFLFGIGLGLLSFIFYPPLLFTKPAFD